MTVEADKKVFNKFIIPGKNGGITIVSQIGGKVEVFKNPVKEKYIPPRLLNNLAALILEAFPEEFQGTEGQAFEEELMKNITKNFPEEQPLEVAERTLPHIMTLGVDIEAIAGSLMSTNGLVRTALSLDSMSKAEQNKKLQALTEAISNHWPGSQK